MVRNISLNKLENVVAVNLALSARNEIARLYVGESSLGYTIKEGVLKPPKGFIYVNVKTLDRLVDEFKLTKVNFIKMDAEGAELDILKGSEKTLTENDELFLAIAAHHYPGENLEVAEYLRTKGFKLFSDGSYVYAFKPSIGSRVLLKH